LVAAVTLAGCGGERASGRDLGPDLSPDSTCTPGEPPRCDGTLVKTCRSDGSGYDYTPCPVGCTNGLCDDTLCPDEMLSTNPHALPTNAWPRFRHDNRNSGVSPIALAAQPTLKWKVYVGGGVGGSGLASGPVVNQDNSVFIGAGPQDGHNGSFYSFDGTGKLRYRFDAMAGLSISTAAVRLDGTAYFASHNNVLFAVDPSGNQAWSYAVPINADAAPIVTRDGIVIFGDDDHRLYALDGNGNLLWKSDPQTGPGEVDGGLAESCDGRIYAAGTNGWTALDAKTGATLWQIPIIGEPLGAVSASPTIAADGTMYGCDLGGDCLAIDAHGFVKWQKHVLDSAGGPSVVRVADAVFVLLGDGNLHALDAATGDERWSRPVNYSSAMGRLAGPIADANQRIYINSTDGFVYAFDTSGQQLWRLRHSGLYGEDEWFGTMAIGNDATLYVPGNDGYLYALQ
jgi:outer membrane protein assembly factor BamB